MQADYLWLYLMEAEGGVYLDADQQVREPLSSLLALAPVAMLPTWLDLVGNSVLIFKQPENAFVCACRKLATDKLVERRFDHVMACSGPAMITAVSCVADPCLAERIKRITDKAGWPAWGWEALLARAKAVGATTIGLKAAYAKATLVQVDQLSHWLHACPPAYKATERHWTNWKGSIYR